MLRTGIEIIGGNNLSGEISVDGAKNAVVLLIPAACLAINGKTKLMNVPNVTDVNVMIDILAEIGANTYRDGDSLIIDSTTINNYHISEILMSKIRHSLLFLGVLVSRFGKASISLPGGDDFGERPIDIHIDALNSLGVDVEINNGKIYAKAKVLPLKAADIHLRFPSFGATVQAILTACNAVGTTIIYNAATDPEIIDLVKFLKRMGVNIIVNNDKTIMIEGTNNLDGVNHEIVPDRLEVGALLVAFSMTKSQGIIHGVIPEHNIAITSLLSDIGVKMKFIDKHSLYIDAQNTLKPFNITAVPYPGLASDLQPQILSLSTVCSGDSIIKDSIFAGRYSICTELIKMGAHIDINSDENFVRISGVKKLYGTTVEAKDIRAAVGLICSGLIAEGTTKLYGVHHLHRGHGNLVEKLSYLGAQIKYIDAVKVNK